MIYWFLCLYRRPLFWFNLRHKSKILHFSLSTNGWSACRFFDLSSILSLYISIDSEWSTDSYVCIVGLYFGLIFDINLKSFISLFRPMDYQLAGFSIFVILSLHISFDSEWSTDSYVCIVGLYFDLIFDINLKYFISLFRPMDDQLAGFSIFVIFFRYISHSIQNLRHKSKILHFSLSTNGLSACRFFDLCYILWLDISFDSEWSTDSYVCIVGLYFDLIFDINLKYFISLFRPMDDQLAGFSIFVIFFRYISHSIQNDLLILMFVS